jgi:general secretion pathway protein B
LSSILRALKKLEEDQARTRGGQIDLARDILRPAGIRRHSPYRAPLLIAGLILAGGLVGMSLMFLAEAPEPLAPPALDFPPPAPAASTPQMGASMDVPGAQPLSQVTPPVADGVAPAAPSAPPVSEKPALPAFPAHPELIISGIVYQADPDSRIAVVNDLPAMTGTRIAGALVEEIRSGSVIFSYQGQHFEVFIKE